MQTYGLTFIPGTWIESIQVAKGSGSVVNGFESISGQINAELRKPSTDKKLFINSGKIVIILNFILLIIFVPIDQYNAFL